MKERNWSRIQAKEISFMKVNIQAYDKKRIELEIYKLEET